MNRIKIIKLTNLPSPPERGETQAKKAGSAVNKCQSVQIVASWIDEWRASKPKDVRGAFADLFNAHPPAIG